MTLDKLIATLQGFKVAGIPGDTEVFVTTENEGTWLISNVFDREDEQDNYPADWNMPRLFLDITT